MKRWTLAFFLGASSSPSLRPVAELGVPRKQLGAVSCRDREPSPRPPTGRAQSLRWRWTSPWSLPLDMTAVAVSLGCSLWDPAPWPTLPSFSWPHLKSLRASWVMTASGELALRELPAEICLFPAMTRTSEGESGASEPCLFLLERRITFVCCRFTGTWLSACDQTSRTKDLTPRCLWQLTPPLPHLS